MHSTIAHRNSRTAKSKVKSGCKTCKTRKVKCDEGHPACSRCITTGRVCDGYGIWGNGGNFYGQRQRPATSSTSTTTSTTSTSTFRENSDTIVPRPKTISFFVASTEEKEYFDWFKCRTAWKLPGTFISDFWITLLLQSSLSEPAILHAILALSSVHKGGILNSDRQERRSNGVPDKQEQFTLQHYVKAISHLQPHFSAKDNKASIRVALIACIVFVSLDFLRGHFTTAQIHLRNGLKLLGETQSPPNKNDGDGLLLLRPCHEAIDGWIVEAFSRLYSQVELFKHLHQHPCLLLQVAEPGPPTLIFFTFKDAWHELERLLNQIFHLTKQAREHEVGNPSIHHSPLLEHQQRIQIELARWLNTYEESKTILIGQNSLPEKKAYQLVRIHHIMVTIMADTCLYPTDEAIYDKHTHQFIHLINHLTDLWTSISSVRPHQAPPGHIINMSGTIVDMAWIPPLYYTAVKCRVHQIRLQAVRLLESSFHREGIWDSKIVARISRKVVEMEERDYYYGGGGNGSVVDPGDDDDFPLCNFLSELDLSLPLLPEEYRIRDVEVVLEGEPMDKVLLFCRQSRDGMDFKVRIGEYHVSSQRWMDVDRL